MSDNTFRTLTERAVALVARGRALDRSWEKRQGGSATVHMWAEEAYDAEIDAFDQDARQALSDSYSAENKDSHNES